MFLYFNSLADHSRNVSVFLSVDLEIIKPNIVAGFIHNGHVLNQLCVSRSLKPTIPEGKILSAHSAGIQGSTRGNKEIVGGSLI